jgi:hypothetical protein
MAKHYVTDGNVFSICELTGENDVYVSGETVASGPQPNDYCSACREVEPEWTHVTDDEYRDLLKVIY